MVWDERYFFRTMVVFTLFTFTCGCLSLQDCTQVRGKGEMMNDFAAKTSRNGKLVLHKTRFLAWK